MKVPHVNIVGWIWTGGFMALLFTMRWIAKRGGYTSILYSMGIVAAPLVQGMCMVKLDKFHLPKQHRFLQC
jgi:hypothetical protein